MRDARPMRNRGWVWGLGLAVGLRGRGSGRGLPALSLSAARSSHGEVRQAAPAHHLVAPEYDAYIGLRVGWLEDPSIARGPLMADGRFSKE